MKNVVKEIVKEIISDSSSSEDGQDIFKIMFDESSYSSEDSARENFMSVVDSYTDSDYKSHFRLERSTIENLIIDYSQSGFSPTTNQGGNPRIGPRKEVHMFVWYLSNTITFRQLGNLFGFPKSSSWIAVQRVSDWLVAISKNHIKWPLGDDVNRNCRLFERRSRIPGVIGAIDGTHIGINAPQFDKECFYNRKQSFTIILQAVVDADKKFVDVCCGEPGSLHDSRVLRRSPLFGKAPPFRDNGRLTDQQKIFNHLHSCTRIVVENAFGLLKGRFRRLLKFTQQRNLQSVKKIVVGACVLHNICISVNDEYNETDEDEESERRESEQNSSNEQVVDISTNRRELLYNHLIEKRII